MKESLTPRQRVLTTLDHDQPDRLPVDFLAAPEVWTRLANHFYVESSSDPNNGFFESSRETVLQHLEVDCRVISYDQFCHPPSDIFPVGAKEDWWGSPNRSTPNRMWRQVLEDGEVRDIWGHRMEVTQHDQALREDLIGFPLDTAKIVDELKHYPWPQPDWWDFSQLVSMIKALDAHTEYHLRFRIGSVFETAWQLRGFETFLLDMSLNPEICIYIMERIQEVLIANLRTVLKIAGDRIDMVYFYDDVATNESLLISKAMWRELIAPYHRGLIEVAKSFNTPVMYHCDGALTGLLPELIEMGIDVLNPIQVDAKGLDPSDLKATFGDKLSFHGGVGISHELVYGTPEDVAALVRQLKKVLGGGGGYILAGTHHLQAGTPIENILAMYQLSGREY